jgi:signal transduction histidine kinase
MSLKLRFFIFAMGLAILPTFILGWTRVDFLRTELEGAGLSPEASAHVLQRMHESLFAVSLVVAVVASFLAFALFRIFALPLMELIETIRLIRGGDLTQRVSVTSKDEMGVLAETFNGMAAQLERYIAQLEESDRAKDNFLAILAHELRNPMAPIVTWIELLQMQKIDDPQIIHGLDVIDRQTKHLRRLLDYILDVSRLKLGRVLIEKERINLLDILHESVETTGVMLESKDQHLILTLPKEPIWMEGDPTRLNQVIINLLKNASEHSEIGGVIALACRIEHNEAIISIRDKGSGIAAEDLGEIFILFGRGASARHKPGGLGVGLYLAKTFIEMHGGTISAHSEGLKKGAEFIIHLPLTENLSEKKS